MTFQLAKLERWAQARLLLACASLSFPACAVAGEAGLDLVCTGNSYKADGPFPTVETFSLKIDGKKPVIIGGPGSEKPADHRKQRDPIEIHDRQIHRRVFQFHWRLVSNSYGWASH